MLQEKIRGSGYALEEMGWGESANQKLENFEISYGTHR
jgi:hypothetical protein